MFSIDNDIIFIFTYVSPEYSPIYDNANNNGIDLLSSKLHSITTSYPNAYLFLCGDFNARVKDFQDFIDHDNLKHIFDDHIQYPSDYFSLPRRSMDTEYNRFGQSLIDLCCIYDIHFLNGRFDGDHNCHYTCIANNGANTVDYMVCSSNIFQYVSNIFVLENNVSVHFPIYCILQLHYANDRVMNSNDDLLLPFNLYKWKNDQSTVFLEKFTNLYYQFQYDNLNFDNVISRQHILTNFSNICTKSASGSQMFCYTTKLYKTKSSWWDEKCTYTKL